MVSPRQAISGRTASSLLSPAFSNQNISLWRACRFDQDAMIFTLLVINEITNAVIVLDSKHFAAKWAFEFSIVVGIHLCLSSPDPSSGIEFSLVHDNLRTRFIEGSAVQFSVVTVTSNHLLGYAPKMLLEA